MDNESHVAWALCVAVTLCVACICAAIVIGVYIAAETDREAIKAGLIQQRVMGSDIWVKPTTAAPKE